MTIIIIGGGDDLTGFPRMIGGRKLFRYSIVTSGAGGNDGAGSGTGRAGAGRNRILMAKGWKDFRLRIITAGAGGDDGTWNITGRLGTFTCVVMSQSGKGVSFCSITSRAS